MISVVVTGHVGADGELRYTGDGTPILNLRVASNDRRKVDGEWKDVPVWLSCSVFGKRAESLSKVVRKGSSVAIRGTLSTRDYDDRNGVKRTAIEVRADDVELTGKRDGGAGQRTEPAQQERGASPSGTVVDDGYGGGYGGGSDDQIPF
jgi:single-strand DNA-binding protein